MPVPSFYNIAGWQMIADIQIIALHSIEALRGKAKGWRP